MNAATDLRTTKARRRAARWQDGRHQREEGPFRRIRGIATAFVALTIFALDTLTPISSAIAVLYVLVLVAVSDRMSRAELWWLCSGCATLTLASFFIDHTLTGDLAATLRLAISVVAIVTTTCLLERNLEARQRYQAQALLLDTTTDAIVLRDMAGRVLLWNRGAERLYGRGRDSMMGVVHHDLLGSGFAVPFTMIEQALEQNSAWDGEIQQSGSDGEVLTVASRWTLQCDPQGMPWAVLETSTDVTAKKAVEQALNQSEKRYRSIFETLAVAVLEYDFSAVGAVLADGRRGALPDVARHLAPDAELLAEVRRHICVVNANPTALALMGLACREHFLESYCDFLPFDDETLRSCLGALETGGTVFEHETSTSGPEGVALTLNIALHFPPAGEPLDRVQCSMVDLTEHRRMADDLARTRSDLEHAMRVTTIGEVSATIAHEVNQPLAAILTYAEAAQRWLGRGPEHRSKAVAALQEVANAAGHAGDIVRGVRRLLSRSSREDLPIPIDDMISDAIRLVRREILESRVNPTLDLAAMDAIVFGDRLLLQQSIINLVINALQAMQGTPDPREFRLSSRVEDRQVLITVGDTGPGFSDDIIEEAMNAFASTRHGGMGLGLAICRSAVEAHGGKVRIMNGAKGGAIVILELPTAA